MATVPDFLLRAAPTPSSTSGDDPNTGTAMSRRKALRTGKDVSKASASLEICSKSSGASLRVALRKYEGRTGHADEVARVTSTRLALSSARTATSGERDFRNDRAEGVRRKEDAEEDDDEDKDEESDEDGEGGEVERFGKKPVSTDASDSELGSETVGGSGRSGVRVRS